MTGETSRPDIGAAAYIVDPEGRVLAAGAGAALGRAVAGSRRRSGGGGRLRVEIERLIAVDQFVHEGRVCPGVQFYFLGRPTSWPQAVSIPNEEPSASAGAVTRFLRWGWFSRSEAEALPNLSEHSVIRDAWPPDIQGALVRRLPSRTGCLRPERRSVEQPRPSGGGTGARLRRRSG